MLRAILASQQPDRCKRAQAFISTQGLEADTVAELVAEEVTRELLTPPEGTGAPPCRPLIPHSQVPSSKDLDVMRLCSCTLPSALTSLHLSGENMWHLCCGCFLFIVL